MTDTASGADTLGRRLATPDARRQRARRGAAASHSVSSYVRRIVRRRDELTDDDMTALRRLVGPTAAADAYAEGIRQGARMAAMKIMDAVAEVTNEPS